jgi:hypothetical protein
MTTRKATRARKGSEPKSAGAVKTAAVRHGVITRMLPSYSTYKRWSDQMKIDWQSPEDPQV